MKKVLSLALALILVLSLLPGAAFAAEAPYDDIAGHWAKSSIERWSKYKIVEGSGGHFRPDASLTRGEMAKILAGTLGLTDQGEENPFADVAADAWYTPYVLRCYVAGIMKGDGANAKPAEPISRQEAMVMLCRALVIAEKKDADLSAYGDGADVADWAKGAVAAMTEGKIVNGVGENQLAPAANINRASIMAILDRAIVQYINTPGSHTLTDKDGIVLVAAAGNVTLTGKTPADILVTPAAKGKTLTFDKAEVTGAVTVQADGAKVVKSESKLPEIVTAGKNVTVEDAAAAAPAGGGGGGGGGSTSPSVTVTAQRAQEDKLTPGDKLTASVSNAGSAKLVWSVGGFDLEQETPSTQYTITAADLGKEIFAKLVKEDGTVAAQSAKFTVDKAAEVDVAANTSPVQIDLTKAENKLYKVVTDGEGNETKTEVAVSENDKLVLSIEEKTPTAAETTATKAAVKEDVETSVLDVAKEVSGDNTLTLTPEQKTELAAATQVKAVDVDLTLVTTTTTEPEEGEEPVVTTTETPVHPVGTTKVVLSAAQLGMAGEDLTLYHFIASHTNVANTTEVVTGEVDEKGETVTFTTNGLSTIWIGNVPPRTVTFDTADGTKVDSQKVRFGGKVNTTKLPEVIERTGYLFCGWNYDLSKTPIITNLTVTAKWVQGTMMPQTQYTVTPPAGDFDVKRAEGRVTLTAAPDGEYGANLTAAVAVTPYGGAVKYCVSADAATAAGTTDAALFTAVPGEGNISLTAVTVTDAQGAVKGGKTGYFIKWLGENDAVLALQELTVVVDDGKGATDTKVVTRNINRGVGTFETYMTSSTKADAPKWVGYVNAQPEREYDENGERMYYLRTDFGFDQNFAWPAGTRESDYDVFHMEFTPFQGESYAGKSISVEMEYEGSTQWVTATVQHSVTEAGKLALTIPAASLDVGTDSNHIYLNLSVTVDGVTQRSSGWFRNPKYAGGSNRWENVTAATLEELRTVLAGAANGAKWLHVNYTGTEDVTLTGALTIPYSANVYMDNCNVTVGNGGVLTLEHGPDGSAELRLQSAGKTFTVAEGGKVSVVRRQTTGNRYVGWISADHVVMESGSTLEVLAGVDMRFNRSTYGGQNTSTCELKAGSVVTVTGDDNDNAWFGVENFAKATLAGQIKGNNQSYLYLRSDENEISGSVTMQCGDSWAYVQVYGDTIITETGSVSVSSNQSRWNHGRLTMNCPLTNKGTISLSGSVYGIFTNTGYAQYNEGTINLGSGTYISCEGTKLVNTGTISGAGELQMRLGDDTTAYGDTEAGVEYVEVDWEAATPGNYSRYKFVKDPAPTIDVTLYKGELVNEQSGTCSITPTTEEFPEN